MEEIRKQIPYTCTHGCTKDGCPGHTAKLTYWQFNDQIVYDDGKGHVNVFDTHNYRRFKTMAESIEEEFKPINESQRMFELMNRKGKKDD